MTDLKILRLELRNFKGQRNLNLDFGGKSCVIYGNNATGKTTVYDAFSWLLFGVDSLGQAAFDIKPLGKDGNVLDHGAVTSVEADLMVNGEHHNLKRTYYEKWSKKRGSVNETYDGNTCDYFLDDVPVKKKLYDETVRNMVGAEETFRVLTNLRRFCVDLPWKERRKLLMNMCWNTTDQAVMEQEGRFSPLLDAMGSRTLDDYRAMLVAKRKNLSGTRDKIPTRLDELDRMLESIPVCDYDVVREEIGRLNHQLQTAQRALDQDGRAARLDQLEQQRKSLEDQRSILEQSNRTYRSSFQQPDLAKLNHDVTGAVARIQSARTSKELSDSDIKSLELELDGLRSQWANCNGQSFQGGICPTCGQELPPDQLQKARADFQETQKRELKVIESRAARRKERILSEKKRRKELVKSLKLEEAALEQAQAALEEAKNVAAQPVPDLPEYASKWAELDRHILECGNSIVELQQDAAGQASRDKAVQLKAEIRQKESLLADECTIRNCAHRRAELEAEQKKAASALEDLDNLLYQDFERIKPHVDRPDRYSVSGLDSIVQLLHKEIDAVGGFAFVRVDGPGKVYVSTSYMPDMSRNLLYAATTDVPGLREGWREKEQAVIELRSLFMPGDGTKYLLDLLSKMSKDSGVTTSDNGVTQTVEALAGVSLKQNVEINPRVKLQPFRTFLEVPQPESEYLLRVDEEGKIGLFEADGGVWKLEAKGD